MLPCFCLAANTNTIAVLFCCRIQYFDICHFFSILFATDQENQRYNNGLPLLRQIVVCLYFYPSHVLLFEYLLFLHFAIDFFCISFYYLVFGSGLQAMIPCWLPKPTLFSPFAFFFGGVFRWQQISSWLQHSLRVIENNTRRQNQGTMAKTKTNIKTKSLSRG